MDQKLQQAKNLKEKLNIIQSQDKRLPPLELEKLYKTIHLDSDAYKILDLALERNFGGLLPDKTSMGQDCNEGVFKKVSESLEDLLLVGLYAKYIENSCRTESAQPLLKQLGYVTERLIRKFRQQGVIYKELHMETDLVIDLVSRLTPKNMTYNPELFELIMKAFENYKDLELLERLATSLHQQCIISTNLNDHHDWLMLLSTILDQAYNGKNFCSHLLLRKVGHHKLGHLISEHKNYLLFNYFDNPDKAVKIFKGLIRYNLSKESITMISEISDIIENHMRETKNFGIYLILEEVYLQVVLPCLLPQIHMSNEIIDLVQFYLVGMAKQQNLFTLQHLDLICRRIKLMIDLKQGQREYFDRLHQFMHFIKQEYFELVFKHNYFQQLFKIVKERCFDQQIQLLLNVWNPKDYIEQSLDDQIYERETLDFVGLENLTNTCFMNSILQALYMTDEFRRFILRTNIKESEQHSKLRKLYMLLTYQKAGFCSPYELKRLLRAPYGNSNDQQDVGEFVHHFLEDLLKFLPNDKQQILDEIFFGCHRTIIQCPNTTTCQPQIGQNEKFLGMVLHLNKNHDLNQMISQIFAEEPIEFTCESCKSQSNQITKSQQIIYLPPVLILTLQRFQYQASQNQNVKVLDKVPLLFSIDMREVFQQPQLDSQDSQYILYAFIVHLGKQSYSGHYSCYARSMTQPETWIAFDDTQITKYQLNSKELNSQLIDEETPYLLFYKNKSGHRLTFNR